MKPIACAVAALALAALLAAGASQATVVLPIDLDGLAQYADTAILGTVTSVKSHWTADNNQIYTTVRFENVDYVKGQGPAGSYALELPGGVIGDLGMEVPGTPRFQVGQRALLFLRTDDPDWMMPIVGWSQGRFDLRDGKVYTDSGLEVVDVQDGRLVVVAAEAAAKQVDGQASPGTPGPPSPRAVKKAPLQFPDREEEMTGPAPRGRFTVLPHEMTKQIVEMRGPEQQSLPKVGKGPIVVPAFEAPAGGMSDVAFLDAVKTLVRNAR